MTEKELEDIVLGLIDSLERKDIDRALSFFTDDATWFTPHGTFNGKNEIRKYMTWMTSVLEDFKFTNDGVGILIQGNKGVHQSTYEGNYKGIKVKAANVCTYEFSGDKMKNHWTINDRLSLARQVVTGPIARKAVNAIVTKTGEGLY